MTSIYRADKVKEHFENLHYNKTRNYVEYDYYGRLIYWENKKGEFSEYVILDNTNVFNYRCWILDDDICFMNILIK